MDLREEAQAYEEAHYYGAISDVAYYIKTVGFDKVRQDIDNALHAPKEENISELIQKARNYAQHDDYVVTRSLLTSLCDYIDRVIMEKKKGQ